MGLVPADEVPDTGCKQDLQDQDVSGRIISLMCEDTPVLRRMALFHIIVNKGNLVLAMPRGHGYCVDH